MNFERGKDIKEALKIGERANALEIAGIADIEIEIEGGFDKLTVIQHKNYRMSGLSESHVIRVLMGIEAMALNPEQFALVFWPNDDSPDYETRVEKYVDMVDYLGKFVKYKDHIYRIPTYEEFQEEQEKRRGIKSTPCWPRIPSHRS